jgi:hypothetical protein
VGETAALSKPANPAHFVVAQSPGLATHKVSFFAGTVVKIVHCRDLARYFLNA